MFTESTKYEAFFNSGGFTDEFIEHNTCCCVWEPVVLYMKLFILILLFAVYSSFADEESGSSVIEDPKVPSDEEITEELIQRLLNHLNKRTLPSSYTNKADCHLHPTAQEESEVLANSFRIDLSKLEWFVRNGEDESFRSASGLHLRHSKKRGITWLRVYSDDYKNYDCNIEIKQYPADSAAISWKSKLWIGDCRTTSRISKLNLALDLETVAADPELVRRIPEEYRKTLDFTMDSSNTVFF